MNLNPPSLHIVVLAIALFILPALAGCGVQDRMADYSWGTTTEQTEQTAPQTQGEGGSSQTRADVKNVRYELAEGWRWDNSTRTTAIKGPEYKIAEQFDGKMEFGGVWEGGAEAAKTHAKERVESYNTHRCTSQDPPCENPPEYKEIKVTGGAVYCSFEVSDYASTWNSFCEFEKNGKTVRFMLYNRADKEMPLLEKMVSTIMWD